MYLKIPALNLASQREVKLQKEDQLGKEDATNKRKEDQKEEKEEVISAMACTNIPRDTLLEKGKEETQKRKKVKGVNRYKSEVNSISSGRTRLSNK